MSTIPLQLRHSLRIDLSLMAPVAGAITALPVVAVFGVGLLVGNDRAAVALAVGANLIAIVSLVGAPRLSLRLAVVDAFTLGLSVFVGTATGTVPWLHIALLVPWCFAAGLLVVFGQTQAVVGSQAIIAYVVLGRFIGSPLLALHLSLFVVAGSLVEILALVVLRLPPSLRYQRSRMASAFEAVAALSNYDPHRPAIGVLDRLDAAERALSAPALFGRTDVQDLRAILDQARRIRLELTTLAGLRVRLVTEDTSIDSSRIVACLDAVSAALVHIADSLRHPRRESTGNMAMIELGRSLSSLESSFGNDSVRADVIVRQCWSHLSAIGGQLRSAAHLLERAENEDGRHVWVPSIPTPRGLDFNRMKNDRSILSSNLRLSSPAFRHAVRLAVAVPVSALVGSILSLPRSYWLPYAVAVILKPDYSTLVKRGLGRVVGTVIGATVAAVLMSELRPNLVLTTLLVATCAWAAYSSWSASFPVSIGFITAMVLILLSTSVVDTVGTALDRFVDISLGAVIAVVAYVTWPTSPRARVAETLSTLFLALHDYLSVVVDLVEAKPVVASLVSDRSRSLRLAWASAETAVGRSVQEPAATRIDPSTGRGVLATTLRILRAIHALRTEAEGGAIVVASTELDALFVGLLATLERLAHGFASEPPNPTPDLRSLFESVESSINRLNAPPSVALHLDELVNAINTASHLTGVLITHSDRGPA